MSQTVEGDGDTGIRKFGSQIGSREDERWLAVGDLSGDLTGGVKRIRGGDDGADRHDGETDDGDVDGIRGEDEDDVASPYSDVVVETVSDTIDGSPEIGEAYAVARGGVDEGRCAAVRLRGDESGDVERGVSRKWQRVAFTVKG